MGIDEPDVRSYEAKPELLKQVMIDQAGDWKKGMIEAIQNSQDGWREQFDADTIRKSSPEELLDPEKPPQTNEKLKVDFNIKEDDPYTLVISDNGVGLSSDQIERWKYFGPSWKASKGGFAGEKGLGRGQTIAMLYDHDKKHLAGDVIVYTNDMKIQSYLDCNLPEPKYKNEVLSKEHIRELEENGVPFQLNEDGEPRVDGFVWVLKRDSELLPEWEERELKEYLQDAVFFQSPFEVSLNGKSVWEEKEREYDKKIEKEDFVIYIHNRAGEFDIYNDYRFIKSDSPFGGLSGHINIFPDLKQNQARNEFTDTAKKAEIFEKIENELFDYLTERAERDPHSLSMPQVSELIKHMRWNDLYEDYEEMKFIPDIHDTLYSLKDLKEGSVLSGEPTSRLSDKASQKGYIVIPKKITGYSLDKVVERLGGTKNISDVEETGIEPPSYKKHKTRELNENQKKFLKFWKSLTETSRNFYVGESDSAIAWTDGSTYVSFNHAYIPEEAVTEGDWVKVFQKTIETVSHELAHTKPDINTTAHGKDHCKRQIAIMEELVSKFNKEFDVSVPEKFLNKMQKTACTLDYTNKEFSDLVDDLINKLNDIKYLESSVQAEQECIEFANKHTKARIIKKVSDGLPKQDLSKFNNMDVGWDIYERGDGYCDYFFNDALEEPRLIEDLAKKKHLEGKPEEIARTRSKYCNKKYGVYHSDRKLATYYEREKIIAEKVEEHDKASAEKLRQNCVHPLKKAIEKSVGEEADIDVFVEKTNRRKRKKEQEIKDTVENMGLNIEG